MRINFTNKNILEIDFSQEIPPELLEALKKHSSWLLGSAQGLIHKNFSLVRGENNLIDPRATLNKFAKENPESLDWFKGLFAYLNTTNRGEIVDGSQTKSPQYSALVPLILAAFKMYRNVGYSEWDWTNPAMKAFVDRELYVAMTTGLDVRATKEELLAAREYSLVIKSGAKMGVRKKPTSQTTITSKAFDSPELTELSRLRKVMDCQIWVAHPSIRTEYMILDVFNPDSMPEILAEEEEKTIKPEKYIEEDIPW